MALRKGLGALAGCALSMIGVSVDSWPASFSKSARGTTGAQFLEIPVGARAVGMGSAQGAAVRDATALYYNPAALAGIEGGDATFMHSAYFEGISYDYLAVARSWRNIGTLALGAQYLTPGSISEVDNTGAPTGGSFSPSDLSVALGWGRAWGPLELGVAAKHISSKIQATANSYAMDVGSRYQWGPTALSFGISHFGQGLKFREKRDPLPTTLRLGSSLDWRRWVFALDLLAPRGTAPYPAVGLEYRRELSGRVALAGRAGYDGRLMQSRLGGLAGAAVGMGLHIGRMGFDYALMPYGDLGVTHRLSLGFAWGARAPDAATPAPGRRSGLPSPDPLSRRLAAADALIDKKRFAEAERTLDEISQSLASEDLDRIAFYETKARSRRLQGDCATAESLYLAGLRLAVRSGLAARGVADCYAGMGLCLIRRGAALDGAVYLRKALEANPSSETRRAVEEELSKIRADGAMNYRAEGFK